MDDLTEPVVLERLHQAFADASLDPKPKLEPGLALEQIDGLDSVSRVRLMLSVEDVFGIEITPKENSALLTIGDLVDLVLSKCGASR
jgi:acyl carrier protein